MDQSEPRQLFAEVSSAGGVLRTRLVGPSVGQREGEIILGMVEEQLTPGAGIRSVVLDCTDVSYINSAGLGSLVRIHNAAKALKANVVLFALTPELDALFKMTKMNKLFKMTNDAKKLEKMVR